MMPAGKLFSWDTHATYPEAMVEYPWECAFVKDNVLNREWVQLAGRIFLMQHVGKSYVTGCLPYVSYIMSTCPPRGAPVSVSRRAGRDDDPNDASRAKNTLMNQHTPEILSKNARFTSKQRSCSHPKTTSTPALRNRAMPPPSTKGLGSPIPTTTRRIPASINA